MMPDGVFPYWRILIGCYAADLGKGLDPKESISDQVVIPVRLPLTPCPSCVLVYVIDIVLGFWSDDEIST